MGRPKEALIHRERVLELALDILDTEGLEALSIRRLASDIGVNSASLYHHFKNKEEILVGAAELAMSRTPVRDAGGDVADIVLAGAQMLRDMLLDHPALIPIIVERRAMGVGDRLIDKAAARAVESGMPLEAVLPLFDSLERYVIGTSIATRSHQRKNNVRRKRSDELRTLAQAAKAPYPSEDQLFDAVVRGMIHAIAGATPWDTVATGSRTA